VPVNIFDADAIEKIAVVDGSDYLIVVAEEPRENMSQWGWELSPQGVRERVREGEFSDEDLEFPVGTFYGFGGANRFYVMGDGTVKVSAHHARVPGVDGKTAVDRAEELGMDVHR